MSAANAGFDGVVMLASEAAGAGTFAAAVLELEDIPGPAGSLIFTFVKPLAIELAVDEMLAPGPGSIAR